MISSSHSSHVRRAQELFSNLYLERERRDSTYYYYTHSHKYSIQVNYIDRRSLCCVACCRVALLTDREECADDENACVNATLISKPIKAENETRMRQTFVITSARSSICPFIIVVYLLLKTHK